MFLGNGKESFLFAGFTGTKQEKESSGLGLKKASFLNAGQRRKNECKGEGD